jgi:polar amino acid transport system substrate-binding protein
MGFSLTLEAFLVNRYFFGLGLFLLGSLTATSINADNKLTLYSYHQAPPFITGKETGLTYDLANYLTQLSPDLQIEVLIIPRKRLDRILSNSPQNIIIPWVSPTWFNKEVKGQFLWSSELMPDASIYIWNNDTHNSFNTPEDLIGHKLGGIRGYRYIGVDPLVTEQQISRSDTNTEKQLIQMVQQQRVDVGIIPFSAAQYLLQEKNWEEIFSISSHQQFSRHLMINSETPLIDNTLTYIISNMKNDQAWQNVMRKYGLITNPHTLEQATR